MSTTPGSNRTTRRAVLGGTAGAAVALGAGDALAQGGAKQPNILFILADDMGFADLSCYGRRDYQTPVLDQLAAQGLQAMRGYSNSAVCTATRTALITGRYQDRFEVGLWEPLNGNEVGLSPEIPTMPSRLKAAGYRTILVGKWHLGTSPKYGPLKSGYETFFGIEEGGADYFTHALEGLGPAPVGGLLEGETPIKRDGYMTDILTDRAIEEIGKSRTDKRPFFMSLHYTAPHWPWEGPGDSKEKPPTNSMHYDGGSIAKYAELVKSLDSNVGRVLAALKKQGLERDTIVVFTSDNGGERFSDTWPFIGIKGELLEGGLRVPLIVRWPGRIKPGRKSDQAIASMDWAPTFFALGGAVADPAAPPDGMDLSAQIVNGAPSVERKLYFRFKNANQAAAIEGSWKYLKMGDTEYLFDLSKDERERANLKTLQPEVFKRLRKDWDSWNAQMLPYTLESGTANWKGLKADRY